jgi:hypothetical protein
LDSGEFHVAFGSASAMFNQDNESETTCQCHEMTTVALCDVKRDAIGTVDSTDRRLWSTTSQIDAWLSNCLLLM